MTNKLDVFWPTSGWPSAGWLGLSASWSFPMSQSGLNPETINALERELLEDIRLAVTEGIEEGFHGSRAPESQFEINQIGSAAEDFHGIFGWLRELPAEVVIALAAERTVRGFAAVGGYVKGRIQAFRRDIEGQEVTAQLHFHPDFLLELCREQVVAAHGATTIDEAGWRPLTEDEQAAIGPVWPPREQYWINIVANTGRFTYRVDESGTAHEHWIEGSFAKAPILVPDLHPVPVPPPTFTDPRTGETVTGWPSQDGVDRSENLAIIAILNPDFGEPIEDMEFVERAGRIASLLEEELERAVSQAVSEILPNMSTPDMKAEQYQVGPMSGELSTFT